MSENTVQQESSGSSFQLYQSGISDARSKDTMGDDTVAYTRVQRTTRGLFDDSDLTLKRYDSAKDTFIDLEAAYKRFQLQLQAERDSRRIEVTYNNIQVDPSEPRNLTMA